ncbi:hypothetical protein ACFY7F_02285 [Streptomyces griseofuscus]|uniref:hypothetical protein n=1 Tax=Streptomyces griseofuscus TaxID=146922 RepID=UPI00369A3DFB
MRHSVGANRGGPGGASFVERDDDAASSKLFTQTRVAVVEGGDHSGCCVEAALELGPLMLQFLQLASQFAEFRVSPGFAGRASTGHGCPSVPFSEDVGSPVHVSLTLRPQDQERLHRLAEVRKDKAVWEHQRTYEQSKRRYRGEDVLKNTGSAVVWWLAKNDEHVEKTVADLGLLAQLTSAANDSDIPERLQELLSPSRTDGPDEFDETDGPVSPDAFGGAPGHRSAADHLSDLFDAMGFPEEDPRRAMLAAQFAHIIKEQNRYETAEEVLRRFAPPEPEDDAA